MSFLLLTPEIVRAIHDEVLNPGELAGEALNKSLDGALARVDNRLAYGMIGDTFDLAAAYATAIATGNCFNDANKRTAFRSMQIALRLNGVAMVWVAEEIGPLIIDLAQGRLEADDLAAVLRAKASG